MSDAERVVMAAARRVTPDIEERRRVGRVAGDLLASTKATAKQHNEVRGVLLGGSYAKDTWLPGDVDIDIFVKLDASVPEDRFEEIGLEIGERVTAGHPRGKKFAQHPYTEATFEGIKANIVPCYDVRRGKWKSAADRSPYHVRLVEALPDLQKLQIRLLKSFMKGVGVYGAEIERQGFSGYAAEVLVMGRGSFLGSLQDFARFKPAAVEGLRVILRDPVDQERDLGRAISSEKLARMILSSRGFLRQPSSAYFMGLKGRRRPIQLFDPVAVTFKHGLLSEDTLWGELKKTLKQLQRLSDDAGFRIARSLAATDGKRSSAFLFLPEIQHLPHLEQRLGPTADRRAAAAAFVAANQADAKLLWVDEEGRLRLMRARRHTELAGLLSEAIAGGPPAKGSTEVSSGLRETGKVLRGSALRAAASSDPWLASGLEELVRDTPGIGAS